MDGPRRRAPAARDDDDGARFGRAADLGRDRPGRVPGQRTDGIRLRAPLDRARGDARAGGGAATEPARDQGRLGRARGPAAARARRGARVGQVGRRRQAHGHAHGQAVPRALPQSSRPLDEQEDAIIAALHDKVGSKWAEIARALPGRPDNAIKNYFNTVINKRNKKRHDGGTHSPAPSSTPSLPGSPAVGLSGPLPFVPQSPRYAPYSTRSSVSLASGESGIAAPALAASQSMPGQATRRRGSSASLMSMQRPHQLKLSMRTQSYDQDSLAALASPPMPASPNDVFDRWTVGTPPATPDTGAIGHGQSAWGLFGTQAPGHAPAQATRARSGSTASTSSQLRRALPPSPRLGPHTRASSSSLSAMSGSGLSVLTGLTGVTTAPSTASGRSSGSMPPTPFNGKPSFIHHSSSGSSGSGMLLGPIDLASQTAVEGKTGHARRPSSASLFESFQQDFVGALPVHAEHDSDDADMTHINVDAWAAQAATDALGEGAHTGWGTYATGPMHQHTWSETHSYESVHRFHHGHSSSSSSIASSSSVHQRQLQAGSYFGGASVLPLTPAMPDEAFYHHGRPFDKTAVMPLDASELLTDDGDQISMPPTHTMRARQTRSSRASVAPPRSRELAGPDLVDAYLQRADGASSPARSDTGTVVGRKLRSSTRGQPVS